MKLLFTFCTFFTALVYSGEAHAQKMFNEGTLTYNISIESTKGEKQVQGSLNGAVLNVMLTRDRSRTEMVSTPGTETTVFDDRSGKAFILKEYSGQKLMITMTDDNRAEKNKTNSSLKFTVDNTLTTIAGYSCKKATAVSADGKLYTVYFDPTVIPANKNYNSGFPQLPGLPVQYELQSGNLIFRHTLTKYVAESIAANKFEAPKTGFRVMSYEENQQLKKGN
ncbi:MAG: hypothetical protein WKF88_03515 [Ferruginibacter sp.]